MSNRPPSDTPLGVFANMLLDRQRDAGEIIAERIMTLPLPPLEHGE